MWGTFIAVDMGTKAFNQSSATFTGYAVHGLKVTDVQHDRAGKPERTTEDIPTALVLYSLCVSTYAGSISLCQQ